MVVADTAGAAMGVALGAVEVKGVKGVVIGGARPVPLGAQQLSREVTQEAAILALRPGLNLSEVISSPLFTFRLSLD